MQTIQRFRFLLVAAMLVGAPILLAGCKPAAAPANGEHEGHDHDGHDHEGHDHGAHGHDDDHTGHDHSHGTIGPHGGEIIELGHNHKYHVEMLEDAGSETIRLIMLDIHLKEIPIQERQIVVQLPTDGQVQSYSLLAEATAAGDGASRFVTQDATLYQAMHQAGGVTGRMRVKIAGVSYVGQMTHQPHEASHQPHAIPPR